MRFFVFELTRIVQGKIRRCVIIPLLPNAFAHLSDNVVIMNSKVMLDIRLATTHMTTSRQQFRWDVVIDKFQFKCIGRG